MKHIIILLSIVTILISCQNEKQNVVETKSTLEKDNENSHWNQLEKNVFETIDNLEKSDSKNRKKYIEKFLSYQDKVDGSIAEAYSNFAFEYMENNIEDFFSVLESNDSLLIKRWSEVSSSEIAIISENKKERDSIWTVIHLNHLDKRLKLKLLEKELDLYYMIKLNEEMKKY